MHRSPLFSVLIANYNNGRFLQEAIDSVMAQTYTHWEVIIVDDGSTDNSQQVYDRYTSDPRFHIHYNNANRGCGFTKHRCTEVANGEICGYLDPDDTLTPNALQVMVEAHAAHPECSLIYSQYYIADANLNISGISQHQRQLPAGETFLDHPISGAISQFATFKLACYRQTAGISPEQKVAVDIDLYLKLEEMGETLFIPTPLYTYRMNTGNNISLGDNETMAKTWDIIARVRAWKRRGSNISAISKIVNTLYEIGYEQGRDDGVLSVRKSKAYRIGEFILRPFKWARNLPLFHKKSAE